MLVAPESTARPISVVMPVWRESAAVLGVAEAIAAFPEIEEVLIVAADASADALAPSPHIRLLRAPAPSRGAQMNLGAHAARGEWLLFHHVDTELTAAHVCALAALAGRTDIAGGAFYRRFDERHPRLRWLERWERLHNRSFGALYGDQSLFVRRTVFEAMGGYAEIPLLEDVEFSRRLRRAGPLALLDPPIRTSPRKHLAQGPWRTTLRNAAILLLYHLGISPHRLHRWYYRAPSATVCARPVAAS